MAVALMLGGPSLGMLCMAYCHSLCATAIPFAIFHACAAGDMPMTLLIDGPNLGGYVCPATPVLVSLLFLVPHLMLVLQGICLWR